LLSGARFWLVNRKLRRPRPDKAAALDPSAAALELACVASVNSRQRSEMRGLAHAVVAAPGGAGFKREAGGAARNDAPVQLSKPIDLRRPNHVSPHQQRALSGLR